jgi:hypothetical protein
MMIKPERAIVPVRQVGDDVSFVDFYQTFLHGIGLNPFHRLPDVQGIAQQNGTNDTVKIRSGYNPHKKDSKIIKTC